MFIGLNFNILNSEKLYEFSDIYKPQQIAVDNNYLYVSEGYGVNLYSLKNFKLIRKIGKKGSGPGEFLRAARRLDVVPVPAAVVDL